ncbi:ketoacyl-ACP synthase III [Pseudoxanthomonas putridarboris]|uniref:Ketoacyl-ACP synthase III n=1 Tax=Pseudoxanthomonas putridarboris TaxID=752605 RepID=A0ABU9IZZ1_9GAMM
MAQTRIQGFRVAGVSTCVPARRVDNLAEAEHFGADEVRKVVSMAGVRYRHVVDAGVTSADLCLEAAARLLERLDWSPDSISGLVFVTQSPDYFLPSTACLLHKWLGLPDSCAAFDIGLGCSGYPYGLYLAATMLKGGGHTRILMLHGETPSRFTDPDDHATTLLFGDAGSATALELSDDGEASFCLHTDGGGHEGLIIRGGGFRDRQPSQPRHLHLEMDGAAIFNFTIKRVPSLVRDALALAGKETDDIDQYVFHQSNRFIMKHLAKKCGLPDERVPMTIEDTANCGGPSVAVTLTRSAGDAGSPRTVMLVGYGVGLSWASAVLTLPAGAVMLHGEYDATAVRP